MSAICVRESSSGDSHQQYLAKDFLLYERMPEQTHSQIIRMGVVPVMQSFRALGGARQIDPTELEKQFGKSITGIYNILHDLRLSGLVARTSKGWEVPEVVRQYEHQGRLGEYVRQSVLRNRMVSDFLIEVEKSDGIAKRDIPAWLQQHFPFMSPKHEVWVTYTNTLVDWIVRLRLVDLDGGEVVRPVQGDKESLIQELGNLTVSGRGARPSQSPFVPSCSWTTAKRVWGWIVDRSHDNRKLSKGEQDARADLVKLGAVTVEQGRRFVANWPADSFDQRVSELLASEPYTAFWDALKEGESYGSALQQALGLNTLGGCGRLASREGRPNDQKAPPVLPSNPGSS